MIYSVNITMKRKHFQDCLSKFHGMSILDRSCGVALGDGFERYISAGDTRFTYRDSGQNFANGGYVNL